MFASTLLALPASTQIATPVQQTRTLGLPIDKQRALDSWEFGVNQIKIVDDEVTHRRAIEPAFTTSPWLPTKPIGLSSKIDLPVPVAIQADFRLPVVTGALKSNQVSWSNGSLGWLPSPQGTGGQARDAIEISRGRFRDDYSYQVDVFLDGKKAGQRAFTPVHTPSEISPLIDDSVRDVLERRAGNVHIAHDRVHRLRVEVYRDALRMFVNGRFTAESHGDFRSGRVDVQLNNQVRLFGLDAWPLLDVPERFVTVPLDDFFNAKGPARPPGLARAPGRVAAIEGVPFVTSAGENGEDNLHLAPSVYLYRLGDMRSGDPRKAVTEPEQMDVTRFTMRVPQRTWRRAWVLAASDDDSEHAPVLTVRFYVPRTAWTLDATAHVPTYEATSTPDGAKRVRWDDAGGKAKSLWLIPIDIDAGALAAEPMGALELTKAVLPYRGYPDPAYYGSYPAGLPSAVHVYGLTLEEAPVWARGTGTKNGNVYVDGETPTWRVLLKNLTHKRLDVGVDLTVTDPYGKSTRHPSVVPLEADGQQHEVVIHPPTDVFGLYRVQTAVHVGDFSERREGTFLKLPPNHAKATPKNSPWGLWCWSDGAHDTDPDAADTMRLLRALGAINSFPINSKLNPKETPNSQYELRRKYGIGASQYRLVGRQLPDWATKDPYDPAAYAAFAEQKGKEAREALAENPDLEYVNLFGENAISLRMTHGMPPWVKGEPWFDYDQKERALVRAHWLTAKAALDGVRRYAPQLKVLFGHCGPNFFEPFFRLPDWRNDLFDGFGLDMPQFERMPERQPRAAEPSLLFFLRHEMQAKGMKGKEIVHLESYFPPAGPLAMSYAEQADNIVRTAVLSLALGTTKFLRTWALFTSGDGWGSSHYGSPGVIDRAPEFNPKPAAAAFATMARVLDLARYDGYLDTGSRSTFCIRFKDTDRLVYAVWTIHGTRPLELSFDRKAQVESIDMQGNATPLKWLNERGATVILSSSPQWIVVRGGSITSAAAGGPSYTDAPRPLNRVIDPLDGGFSYDSARYERFESNHWDMPREAGEMKHAFVNDGQRRSKVLRVELQNPKLDKPMVGFYGLFKPPKPIELSGKPKALGVWVNGHSTWGRIIYELVDAKGEVWINNGTKDGWNDDDIHSWSSVNHDGWRYMSFPLPGTAPGDNYREADTTWWGSDGDHIVDLPLKLTRIIIEMRPKMVYVNDVLPIGDPSLEMDDLTVEYEREGDETEGPVKAQIAARNVLSEGRRLALRNPFDDLSKQGRGAAPTIEKLYPPDQVNDGRRLFVEVRPVAGAARYRGYVSAYPDGRGAQALAIDEQSKHWIAASLKGKPNTLYFEGFQPDRPMYLFVTTIDRDGRESKPSAIRRVILKDEFPFK